MSGRDISFTRCSYSSLTDHLYKKKHRLSLWWKYVETKTTKATTLLPHFPKFHSFLWENKNITHLNLKSPNRAGRQSVSHLTLSNWNMVWIDFIFQFILTVMALGKVTGERAWRGNENIKVKCIVLLTAVRRLSIQRKLYSQIMTHPPVHLSSHHSYQSSI